MSTDPEYIDFASYIRDASRTEPLYSKEDDSETSDTHDLRLLHAVFGMSTEAGEILDVLKKRIFYKKPIDHVNLMEEAGDIMWYMSLLSVWLADEYNMRFSSPSKPLITPAQMFQRILDTNIKKLRTRFPSKFTEQAAQVRDLAAERTTLEQHTP